MKRITIAGLSLALAVCMLGGCGEKTEIPSEIIVESTASVSSVSSASTAQTTSSKTSTSSKSSSTKKPNSSTSTSTQTSSSSTVSSSQSVVLPEPEPQIPEPQSTEGSSPESTETTIESTETTVESTKTTESTTEEPIPVPPSGSFGTNSYQALNYSEVKGIWISYIELAGLSSGSESAFRSAVGKVYDNCVSLGINTVFVHVRSHGDAYYYSGLFPRTKYIGGGYDPLPIMIEEAHDRGLSFQAWINPLRGCSVSDIGRENGYPMYDWAGDDTRLVEVNGYYYLNPAYSEVIELIAGGAEEIVAKYDVDGLHIDDYFYPTTEKWFDEKAFEESSYNDLDDFRFANCDRLVSSLYSAVKSANSTAIFGVSPQGNYYNNYYYMYADVEKWCTHSGYLDYIMPQIYFGFKNEAQPYVEVLEHWDNIASSGGTKLIVGLAPSKIGQTDGWGGDEGRREWIDDKEILKRQILEAFEQKSYGGICLYSYNSLFNPSSDVSGLVKDELNALKTVLT